MSATEEKKRWVLREFRTLWSCSWCGATVEVSARYRDPQMLRAEVERAQGEHERGCQRPRLRLVENDGR